MDPERQAILNRLERGEGRPQNREEAIARVGDPQQSVRICIVCFDIPAASLDYCGPCKGADTIRWLPSIQQLERCEEMAAAARK